MAGVSISPNAEAQRQFANPKSLKIASTIFNGIFRKNAAFLTTVFLGAFAFEMAFDTGTDAIWNSINKGRQWKDIKQKYISKPEDEDGGDEDE